MPTPPRQLLRGIEHGVILCRSSANQPGGIGSHGPEGGVVFDLKQLAELQPGNLVGVPGRQHVVSGIRKLGTDLQQIGHRHLAGLDHPLRLSGLDLQLGDDLLGIADRLLGAQHLQVAGRDVQPHAAARRLHGKQRRSQVEFGPLEVVVVAQSAEKRQAHPDRGVVARYGLILHKVVGRGVQHAPRRKRVARRSRKIGGVAPLRFGKREALLRGREFLRLDLDILLVSMCDALFQRPAPLLSVADSAEEQHAN